MAAPKGTSLGKFLLTGIFVLLLFISYQLYINSRTPKTAMDCLQLGSNERTKLCLLLLKHEKTSEDYPLDYLTIENISGEDDGSCIKLSGTLYNTGSQPATLIALRADFLKEQNGTSFHYEVFSPFQTEEEQVQPYSRKGFSKCMNYQTATAVRGVKQWYFSILPHSARVFTN